MLHSFAKVIKLYRKVFVSFTFQINQAQYFKKYLQVVSFFNGVLLPPISSVFAIIFWSIQITVHTPKLEKIF